MKTFLGFTTGALLGLIGGAYLMALGTLTDKGLRKYINDNAFDN